MCLSNLDPAIAGKFADAGGGRCVGWKVFLGNRGILSGVVCGHEHRRPGKWLDAHDFSRRRHLVTHVGEGYPAGWHMFPSKAVAERWAWGADVVRKVLAKGPLAFGPQGSLMVGVFRYMRILPEKGAK